MFAVILVAVSNSNTTDLRMRNAQIADLISKAMSSGKGVSESKTREQWPF